MKKIKTKAFFVTALCVLSGSFFVGNGVALSQPNIMTQTNSKNLYEYELKMLGNLGFSTEEIEKLSIDDVEFMLKKYQPESATTSLVNRDYTVKKIQAIGEDLLILSQKNERDGENYIPLGRIFMWNKQTNEQKVLFEGMVTFKGNEQVQLGEGSIIVHLDSEYIKFGKDSAGYYFEQRMNLKALKENTSFFSRMEISSMGEYVLTEEGKLHIHSIVDGTREPIHREVPLRNGVLGKEEVEPAFVSWSANGHLFLTADHQRNSDYVLGGSIWNSKGELVQFIPDANFDSAIWIEENETVLFKIEEDENLFLAKYHVSTNTIEKLKLSFSTFSSLGTLREVNILDVREDEILLIPVFSGEGSKISAPVFVFNWDKLTLNMVTEKEYRAATAIFGKEKGQILIAPMSGYLREHENMESLYQILLK